MSIRHHFYTPAITDEELEKRTEYVAWRRLPDGSVIAVGPMAFGNGRLFMDVSTIGYEDCYCYDSVAAALIAFAEFNPDTDEEPEGWKRHPHSGRRRPGGDKSQQTINF